MEILREIGRIRGPVRDILTALSDGCGIEEAMGDVRDIGRRARWFGWTRDPCDRLIVAHAQADDATLLTADESIREHFPHAVWG
jgi:PIN domain nuclease of toxin-antitoxin system